MAIVTLINVASSKVVNDILHGKLGKQFLRSSIIQDDGEEEDREGTKEFARECALPKPSPPQPAPKHPCANSNKTHTVVTPDGKKIQCIVPDEKELVKKLEGIGGYNRHYVAVTLEEAEENFDDLLESESTEHKKTKKISKNFWSVMVRELLSVKKKVSSVLRGKRQVSVNCRMMTTAKGTHLCPACQHVTRLDESMFPKYINELSCAKSNPAAYADSIRCFYNMGKCYQESMSVDLLTRTGNFIPLGDNKYQEEWVKKTQKIKTCCECVRKS
ncbi:predicted protein [Nematostella vectensis]|uniref:Uncharacterized protein n=2 Tax=Nematostella vectensis TaxID=45351 RepID=A7RNJ0_NEMVE|nr:predicted protein [Nematostella vectensis]|eukprot:XP_001638930.1 predicted protein [Nematostella vectensis]